VPRPERAFRTPALILRRRDFGEADRLLTVLTPQHGKIDVLAKGARKLTSHKMGHVELFTRADMLIHTGRDFGVVSQAEMTGPFNALREDLVRGAYAATCAELIDRFFSTGEDDTARLYALAEATFTRIDSEPDPRCAQCFFELHVLDLAGFRPELLLCAAGEPVLPQDQVFCVSEGGVVCPQHAPQFAGRVMPLPMATLKLLRLMQRSRYEQVVAARPPAGTIEDAARVLSGYITYVLERRLQSAEFLRRIRREATPAPGSEPA
jgi:DNA repair protein RecO (recombination protein O)